MTILDQLKRDEGKRLRPYKDSVGKLTIGYGRNLDDEGISDDEAELMLANDIENHRRDLFRALPWVVSLDEVRLAVLLNMCFNVGIAGLCGFKQTLSLVQQQKWDAAADEMLQSKWATQVGPRAHRLALQLKTGQWV